MATDIVKNNKKKGNKILKIFLVVGLLLIGIIGYGVYWAFFDMNRLPTGEYITEETSPNGTYTLKAYVSNIRGDCRAIPAIPQLWSLNR